MVLFTKQNETDYNLVQDREQTPDNRFQRFNRGPIALAHNHGV